MKRIRLYFKTSIFIAVKILLFPPPWKAYPISIAWEVMTTALCKMGWDFSFTVSIPLTEDNNKDDNEYA